MSSRRHARWVRWIRRAGRYRASAVAALVLAMVFACREAGTAAGAAITRSPIAPAVEVAGVTAIHRHGQTFVTWTEIGTAPPDRMTIDEFNALRQQLGSQGIRYRIYRASAPITDLGSATLVGDVGSLQAWNPGYFGRNPPGERIVPRYVIEDGADPLAPGTGLFVLNAPSPGQAYYAVTVVAAGAESRTLGDGSVSAPVTETVGPGTPVLQHVETPDVFYYVGHPTLRTYVRWEPAEHASVPGRPFDYLVGVPPDVRDPAPVGIHLHGWGGSMRRDYGWWFNAEKGAVLVSSNQDPYDWWTGYHERRGVDALRTPADWQSGVVRPYTARRMLGFVDWLETTMPIDRSRVFTAGNSMGGSGAIMLAIRYPDLVAWTISWVGVHIPRETPTFRSSYAEVYGEPDWGVKYEDGTPVWDYYDDAWYLRRYPDRDVGFITFSNGKNDHGIGWSQAVEFLRALQETRQPHLFVWGQEGHGQRAAMPGGGQRVMPLDLRTDQSLPAFTRSTLDGDPGNGDPDSGDPGGQVNRFLIWQPESIVEETDRWSVQIAITENGPVDEGLVDVTPRRLQALEVAPGDVFSWTNERGTEIVQQGTVTADEWGLITVPQVQIRRGGTRLTITRR